MKKVFIFFAIFLLLCFLSSPFVSLILPVSLRDHTYREIIMHVIAKEHTRSARKSEDIARKLFYFSSQHTFQNPGNLRPYDDKAPGYLINGAVYCDYAADILAALCAQRGIPARYCMLMNKDGVSPHTVAEIFLDGAWRVFDPAEIYYYTRADAKLAALDDLSNDPGLIFKHKRMLKIKELRPREYADKCAWYKSIFPVPQAPQRSKSKTKRISVFDRVGFLYYDIFGKNFLRAYQDAYLKCRGGFSRPAPRGEGGISPEFPVRLAGQTRPYSPEGTEADKAQALYYTARSYQLTKRTDEAIRAYDQLLRLAPDAELADKARIFYSFIYMDDRADYPRAINILSALVDQPQNIYAKYALYYTGACYKKMGDSFKAREYFDASGIAVYLDPELAN